MRRRYFIVSVVVVAIITAIRISFVSISCSSLDVGKIKLMAVEKHLNSKRNTKFGVHNKNGEIESFDPIVPSSAQIYLNRYPDCCYYRAVRKDAGTYLTWWERFAKGRCGFVSVASHIFFWNDNQLQEFAPASYGWLVDFDYNLISDPKERV